MAGHVRFTSALLQRYHHHRPYPPRLSAPFPSLRLLAFIAEQSRAEQSKNIDRDTLANHGASKDSSSQVAAKRRQRKRAHTACTLSGEQPVAACRLL